MQSPKNVARSANVRVQHTERMTTVDLARREVGSGVEVVLAAATGGGVRAYTGLLREVVAGLEAIDRLVVTERSPRMEWVVADLG